jgi:hypothetical protein
MTMKPYPILRFRTILGASLIALPSMSQGDPFSGLLSQSFLLYDAGTVVSSDPSTITCPDGSLLAGTPSSVTILGASLSLSTDIDFFFQNSTASAISIPSFSYVEDLYIGTTSFASITGTTPSGTIPAFGSVPPGFAIHASTSWSGSVPDALIDTGKFSLVLHSIGYPSTAGLSSLGVNGTLSGNYGITLSQHYTFVNCPSTGGGGGSSDPTGGGGGDAEILMDIYYNGEYYGAFYVPKNEPYPLDYLAGHHLIPSDVENSTYKPTDIGNPNDPGNNPNIDYGGEPPPTDQGGGDPGGSDPGGSDPCPTCPEPADFALATVAFASVFALLRKRKRRTAALQTLPSPPISNRLSE